MSNEELAARGTSDPDAMLQLYQDNKTVIYKICSCFTHDGLCIDDLMQEAFFALVLAVQAFNEHREYKFITYLSNALKWHFLRFVKQDKSRHELLTLDEPASSDGDGEATRCDLLSDEAAPEAFEAMLDSVALSGIFDEACRILSEYAKNHNSRIPYDAYITDYYRHGMTYKQIADKRGVSPESVRTGIKRALRVLRNPMHENLHSMRDDFIDRSIKHSSLSRFRESGTSGVEWAIIQIEEYARRAGITEHMNAE